jgi:1-acyl-sn-glycerol-3-phosphate acyltransferase
VLIAKGLVPIRAWRRLCDRLLVRISYAWTAWNTRLLGTFGHFRVQAKMPPDLKLRRDARYLLLANHQSFTDIFVLQAVFHPRTPFLTFFLKRQLFYFPVFGLIWWALGFPFMQRHSPAYVAKHPEKKFQDLETTHRFCERIRGRPYAIINFVEGTRRTPGKAHKSPYQHLLPPRAGGVATALQALDYEFDHILDVTIQYRSERNSMSDMLAGRVGDVQVTVREVPLSEIPHGDYFRDPVFATRFRDWLNQYWADKDRLFTASTEA